MMKSTRRTFFTSAAALSLATAFTFLGRPTYAGPGDVIPPAVTIGLADSSSMSACLPLLDGQAVTPDAHGLIRFRAQITDAGSGVRNVLIQVPHSSGSSYGSPTPCTYIGAAWDTRRDANGKVGTVTVTAFDYAGNRTVQTISVVLQK